MMNKLEYLRVLENGLRPHLGKGEVDEIMRDYAEYFVEGKRQGKSDYEIAYKLGDPREVARQIVAESRGEEYSYQYTPNFLDKVLGGIKSVIGGLGKMGGFLGKCLILLLVVLLLPVVGGLGIGVLGVLLGVFAGLFAAALGCVSVVVAGFLSVVAICLCLGVLPASGIVALMLLAGGCISAGIFGVSILTLIIRFVWKLVVSGVFWVRRSWSGQRPMGRPTPDGWAAAGTAGGYYQSNGGAGSWQGQGYGAGGAGAARQGASNQGAAQQASSQQTSNQKAWEEAPATGNSNEESVGQASSQWFTGGEDSAEPLEDAVTGREDPSNAEEELTMTGESIKEEAEEDENA